MKQRKLAIAAALLALSVWAEGEVWCLVTDGGERIAMSSVVCLAAADDDSTFTVVTDEGIHADVRRAYFVQGIPTATVRDTESGIITARDVLSLSHCEGPVSLFSTDGKCVLHSEDGQDMDISKLPAGLYVIKIKEKTFKFRKP